ncbi:MAG TPA: UTP--glucose-1-phosphate uridylyltransferase GalU [Candidatus Binatia bacterium]|nr:UTP--glucose-1-phosphate uridylyltransferase GalU [Candidatus Binatia bacterium]
MAIKVKKAVIPVAGLGTRLLPATKTVPKEMLPIVDTPSIQYVVEEAFDSGLTEMIFVTARGKDTLEDHFDFAPELEQVLEQRGNTEMLEKLQSISTMIDVVSVRQKKPLGLGHAVLSARNLVGNEPFAVLLSDDVVDDPVPCVRQLLNIYESKGDSVVALRRVARPDVKRYGIIQGREIGPRTHEIVGMVEKPDPQDAPSDLAIVGRYVLHPDIFGCLERVKPGKGGEIQLTDAMADLNRQRKFYGYEFTGEHYDIGDKLGFVRATVAYALKRPDLAGPLREFLRTIL